MNFFLFFLFCYLVLVNRVWCCMCRLSTFSSYSLFMRKKNCSTVVAPSTIWAKFRHHVRTCYCECDLVKWHADSSFFSFSFLHLTNMMLVYKMIRFCYELFSIFKFIIFFCAKNHDWWCPSVLSYFSSELVYIMSFLSNACQIPAMVKKSALLFHEKLDENIRH